MLQFVFKCALAIQSAFVLGGCGNLPIDFSGTLDAQGEAEEAQYAEIEADSMADRMEHFWGCFREMELRGTDEDLLRRGCASCAQAYDVPMKGMCVGIGGEEDDSGN